MPRIIKNRPANGTDFEKGVLVLNALGRFLEPKFGQMNQGIYFDLLH